MAMKRSSGNDIQARIEQWMHALPPFPPQANRVPGDNLAPITRDGIVWLTMKTGLSWFERGAEDSVAAWMRASIDVLSDQWAIIEEDEEGFIVAQHCSTGRFAGGYWDYDCNGWRWGTVSRDDKGIMGVDPEPTFSLFLPDLVHAWNEAGVNLAKSMNSAPDDNARVFVPMPEARLFVLNRLFAIRRAFGESAWDACRIVARAIGLWTEEPGDMRGHMEHAFFVFDPQRRHAAVAWFDAQSVGFSAQTDQDHLLSWLAAIGYLEDDEYMLQNARTNRSTCRHI